MKNEQILASATLIALGALVTVLWPLAGDRATDVVGKDADVAIRALVADASTLRNDGRYEKARRLLNQALALAESRHRPEDPLVAATLNQLGIADKYAGRFAEAKAAYLRALTIVERRASRSHAPEIETMRADVYHNLGGLAHAQDRFAEGEPFARRSVEIRTAVLGPDHLDTAADKAALAALLDGQGKYAEAETLYHEAIAGFERAPAEHGYDLAVNLNNLAALYFSEGRTPDARALYEEALRIKETILSPEHPDIATTLNNLAVLEAQAGDLDRARQHYQRALAIFERSLSPDHPKLIECRKNFEKLQKKSD